MLKSSFSILPKVRYTFCNFGNKLFSSTKTGYLLGVYEDEIQSYTDATQQIDEQTSGNLTKLLTYDKHVKEGTARVLYGLSDSVPIAAIVGLGKKDRLSEPLEEMDENRNAVRAAVAAGCNALKKCAIDKIIVDPCNDAEAAAEGSLLSMFEFKELKSKKDPLPSIECFKPDTNWSRGVTLSEGQNIARRLMELPANIMTPTNFAQEAVTYLEHLGVEVKVRTKEWAQDRKMNAFLSVSKGSAEPPIFLDIAYKGAEGDPLCLVGKGVTFDSGGISIKPAAKMEAMRADMGGAACTIGALYSIASLKLPFHVRAFIPLCENLPSSTANKPGDVVVASNGKSIQIDNTDAEGRLILADALHYASQHKPYAIIDMATLTGAMMVALGACATGVFSTNDELWKKLHNAGHHTGDRVWRMPLFKLHTKQVTDCGYADVHNLGKKGSGGGASLAAAFLKEFVTCDKWMHLDIASVMENSDEVPYLCKGMAGRPTRTIVQVVSDLSKAQLSKK